MDKSKQGFIDHDIMSLVNLLNEKGYKTTSSCSGRIVLLDIREFGDKQHAEWLYKTHHKADPDEVFELLEKGSGQLYFLQEPPIIHANCKDMQDAERLLNLAVQAGFKRSGIISVKNMTVEIASSERLETPLEKDMVTHEFVDVLVDEANIKLLKGKGKLKRLQSMLERA